MPSIETIAISKLITSEEYTRKVLPFIKEDYFETLDMKTLFGEINDYFTKYDQVPEINALKIEIDKRKDLRLRSFLMRILTINNIMMTG